MGATGSGLKWDWPCCGSVAQSCPVFATPWTAAHQVPLSFIIWSLLKLMPFESVMPPSRLILCHRLLLPPSVFPASGFLPSGTGLHIPDPPAPHLGPGGNPQHRGPSEGPVRCKSSWELQAQGRNLQCLPVGSSSWNESSWALFRGFIVEKPTGY